MSEHVVLHQPWPSPPLPYEFDEQSPVNNSDVQLHTIRASENSEETEEQKTQCLEEKVRRNRNKTNDCCCDCDDDDDVDYCVLCLRFFCNPWRLLCRALAECTDGCCECCANCIQGCCEAGSCTEPSGGGEGTCDCDNGGCCDGDNDNSLGLLGDDCGCNCLD